MSLFKNNIVTKKRKLFWQNINSFYDSVKPVYYLSKIFGYAAYQLPTCENNCEENIKVLPIDFGIFMISCVIYIFFLYWNISHGFNVRRSTSLILDIGGQFVLVSGLIIGLISIIFEFMHRTKILKIFRKIYEFDQCLLETGCQMNHNYFFKLTLLIIYSGVGSGLIAIFGTYLILKNSFESNPLIYLGYTVQNLSFTILLTHFVQLLLAVKMRFSLLNKCLWYEYNKKKFYKYIFYLFLVFLFFTL